MSDMVDIVTSKMDAARAFAVANQHLANPQDSSTIAHLLQVQSPSIGAGNWCSISSSHRIEHALLWGRSPFVNISAVDSADALVARFGFNVDELVRLADSGLVIPKIYEWKKPEVWKTADDRLKPLLERSIATQPAIESYLRLAGKSLDSRRREEEICKKIQSISREQLEILARDEAELPAGALTGKMPDAELVDRLSKAWGARWAYLDALATPDVHRRVAQLFHDDQISGAVDYLRYQKAVVASPITAAIGGLCLWGKTESDRAKRSRFLDPSSTHVESHPRWDRIDPRLLRLATLLMTQSEPEVKATKIDIAKLIDIATSEEFVIGREKVFETLGRCSSSWSALSENDAEMLDRVREFQNQRRTYARYVRSAFGRAIDSMIGYLLQNNLGKSIGVSVGVGFVLELIAEPVTDRILSADPRYRLIIQSEQIRERAKSSAHPNS